MPVTREEADLDYVRPVVGMHVGLLIPQELAAFERLVAAGKARRSYEGAAGFLGLAKVRLVEPVALCEHCGPDNAHPESGHLPHCPLAE